MGKIELSDRPRFVAGADGGITDTVAEGDAVTTLNVGDKALVTTDAGAVDGVVVEINAHWIVLERPEGAVMIGAPTPKRTLWIQTKHVRVVERPAK